MTRRLIFLTGLSGEALDRVARAFGSGVTIVPIYDLGALFAAQIDAFTSLISFGSGVIVPADMLARFAKPAYNVHSGTPDFPGRDPHHHAIYRGATTYGATLHIMTAHVDDGPIVGLETFPIILDATPASLLAQANEAGIRLIERYGQRLLEAEPLPVLPDAKWGSAKTRRADFQNLCALSPLIAPDEFARRFRAFDGGSYDNLTMEFYGHTFRIDKRVGPLVRDKSLFGEFTEAGFRSLLRSMEAGGYGFARYGERPDGRHVLWRHDVDASMHRAARLAEIEAELGVVATYFVNPRSVFYNLLEPEIEVLLRRIRSLGHEIGLHFDAGVYSTATWTSDSLESALRREQSLVENLLQSSIKVVSWHNPDQLNLLDFDADEIAGMLNVYAGRLRRDYAYCSDSNGYWRFKPMGQVISEGHDRLHLLTHPEWWLPEAMSPSERIDRAILGRARKIRRDYDAILHRGGRRNVTAADG
jgi:Formyl transferase